MSYSQNIAGELLEEQVISAEELGSYDNPLIPPGEYDFTVVNIAKDRYQPNPNGSSKIGACWRYTVTFRITNPEDGHPIDLKNNYYMWSTTQGMIAQYYDSIGLHRKGEPLRFNWNPDAHIGRTGRLVINHKDGSNGNKFNNIQRLLPADQAGQSYQQQGYQQQSFQTQYQQSYQTATQPNPSAASAQTGWGGNNW